ncbi:hypothetical protein [Crenothrix sp.]|uniref:hypothetical protein n=1 Tax=Crenothrix sp. TaxID=3100433 RepID=UPI00374D77E9
MKTFAFILLLSVCFLSLPAEALNRRHPLKVIKGTISQFESADNFYLTILDKKGKPHTALCNADLCEKLMMATGNNLGGYKGKKVRVIVGTGNQIDGSGRVMGTMDAFVKIQLIK